MGTTINCAETSRVMEGDYLIKVSTKKFGRLLFSVLVNFF